MWHRFGRYWSWCSTRVECWRRYFGWSLTLLPSSVTDFRTVDERVSGRFVRKGNAQCKLELKRKGQDQKSNSGTHVYGRSLGPKRKQIRKVISSTRLKYTKEMPAR
jgi:hypothetical protein